MSTTVTMENSGPDGIQVRIEESVILDADAYTHGESGLIEIRLMVRELCDNFGIPFRDEVDMQSIHDYHSGFMPD